MFRYDIDANHHFSGIISNAERLKDLHGPVYDIEEHSHHFKEMTGHIESLIPLAKPIYVDEKHSYNEQVQQDHGVKLVHGPVYVKENVKHNYSEQPKAAELQAIYLTGPIYMTDDYKHHYSAIQEHVESLKSLKGPIYQTEGKNLYNEIIKHVEKMKDLKGPIYELEEVEHKFAGGHILQPSIPISKTLHAPRYFLLAASNSGFLYHFADLYFSTEVLFYNTKA